MFRVKHVITGEILTVYGMNGMYFLAWDPDRGCWGWVQMEKYAPVAEPCDVPYWATEQAYKNGFEAGKREARKSGNWEGEADGYADGGLVYDVWHCSECNYCIDDGTDDPEHLPKFCPNCGADMLI